MKAMRQVLSGADDFLNGLIGGRLIHQAARRVRAHNAGFLPEAPERVGVLAEPFPVGNQYIPHDWEKRQLAPGAFRF